MKRYLIPLFWLVSLLAGCATPKVPDSVPVVGDSIERAQARVESAEALVTRAVPETNPTGKALLAAANDEQAKAISDLDETKAELVKVTTEREQVEAQVTKVAGERDAVQTELAKVKSGWGYRLQQFVLRMFWLIVSLTALHFVLGIVALFVSGPAGNVLAKIGAFVNPFAWFQTLRDNHFFNKKCPDPKPAPQ